MLVNFDLRYVKVKANADQMCAFPFILPPGCPYIIGSQRSYVDVARFFVDIIDNYHRQAVVFC
jgi:hypothetical protein